MSDLDAPIEDPLHGATLAGHALARVRAADRAVDMNNNETAESMLRGAQVLATLAQLAVNVADSDFFGEQDVALWAKALNPEGLRFHGEPLTE